MSKSQNRDTTRWSQFHGTKMRRWYLLAFVTSVALGSVSSSRTFTDRRNSFAQFENWDASKKGSLLRFRFKTYLSDCLLLYQNSQSKGRTSEFLAVELSGGILIINSGSGPRATKVGEGLNDLKWHAVALERINKHTVNISLDGVLQKTTVSHQQPPWKMTTYLYFGGLPSTDFGGQKFVFPSKKNRFVGCLEGPEVSKGTEGALRNATLLDFKGVVNGCTDICDKGHRCENGGTCVNMFITAECDCRHTAFEGPSCQRESLVLNLQTMDYATYQIPPATTLQDRITFRFKTSKSDGVILETSFYHDFLVVELKSGSIHVTWNLGAQDLALSTGNRTYDDNTWHFADIQRDLRRISLSVDDELCVSKKFPGRFVGFDMKDGGGKVFIGGVNTVKSWAVHKQNYQGCLQKLTFNSVNLLGGLKTGTKGYSLKGTGRWDCAESVSMTTVRNSAQRSGNHPKLKPLGVLTEKLITASKQGARSRNRNRELLTLCSVDDEDCIGGESASGSGAESSGDSRGGESGSGDTTATGRPTVTSSPEGTFSTVQHKTNPTDCSSDDEDCGGSGEEAGSGWGNRSPSLPTVIAAKGRKGRKKNQVPAIVSVAVVSFLLVAFLVFVGVWCYNHGGKGYTLSPKKMSVTLNP